ncbi:SPOR domain-containing protein [Epibacterium ulvae]|uniref:SPOR domain-containing protein n=1 Tax=Epibacterium ulvae TaxID=1156985 RepID=UPI0024923927|nr:SPOR domain-containing protein [Epibacterium ulvae]
MTQAKTSSFRETVLGKPRLLIAVSVLTALSACEDGSGVPFIDKAFGGGNKSEQNSSTSTTTELVERDVEAPDVFQVTEAGLWDGRPSLGGVWVAHPDARDPERVLIRNNANGKFVVGALFRREREIPGPRVQISSDAADALGMLAGAPVEVNVTALRREAVAEPVPSSSDAPIEALQPAPVETASLDPIAGAAAAIEASTRPAAAVTPAPSTPTGVPSTTSSLEKPFIQIGIFSVEDNAKRTADIMRNAGIIPTVLSQSSNGKPFWRVVVGPTQTQSERSQLLNKVKSTGFADAYAVTN